MNDEKSFAPSAPEVLETPGAMREGGVALPRVVCWFSCGDPSAVAAKLALSKYTGHEVVVARIRIENEHPDNDRFASDVEKWLGVPIVVLASDRYKDCWEVWERRRFLNGPKGALCTTEMKKMVRQDFQRADDIQVFGYRVGEEDRAADFRANNFEITLATPLLDAGLTQSDCHAIVQRAGIELPAMYRLGYHNNNCIGCVKGGMGYWNKIRVDFPDVFQRMAGIERAVNHSCIHDDDGAVFLDALDPKRGHYPTEQSSDCSLLCVIAEQQMRAS